MKKLLKSGFFIVILLSPMMGWLLGADVNNRVKLNENRSLSKMPEFSLKRLVDSRFYADYEKFFNDHFIFRAPLVKAKNWMDFYLFNTSPTPRVFKGKNGWLYLATDGYRGEMEDYFKLACDNGSKENMAALAEKIHEFEKMVEASGRRFVFLVVPNKSTIYPEHVGLQRRGCKSHYDLFLEALADYPVKNFVRLDQILSAAKHGKPVYYRTDTHWNINGAVIAGEAILRHIDPVDWKRYAPKVVIERRSESNDLSNMISLGESEESDYAKGYVYPSRAGEAKMEMAKPIAIGREMSSLSSSSKDLLPRVIVFGDSFMNLPLHYMGGSFTHIDTVGSLESLNGVKEAEIVVLEIVERYLPSVNMHIDDAAIFFSAYKLKKRSSHGRGSGIRG